jgi:hypothetical protein
MAPRSFSTGEDFIGMVRGVSKNAQKIPRPEDPAGEP